MKFLEQNIPGVWLIQPEPFEDERGRFRRHFCMEEFALHGLAFPILQTNFSENRHKHTLRGIHYRDETLPEVKLLTCIRGSVFNVIVDLRRGSPTFAKWISLELSQQNGFGLYLPHGCGNAFLTLEDDTVVHYYHSSIYRPGVDRGARFNDPRFNIQWPTPPVVISEKDARFPDFAQAE